MENDIHKELTKIAPMLAAMDKKNPFSVPEGYFSNLESRTFDALGKKPILTNSPPAGYFEGLSDQILAKVEEKEKPKVIPLYRRHWLTIAASFLVLAGAIYLMNKGSEVTNTKSEFALEFEVDEGLDYLVENGDLYLSDLMSLELEVTDVELESSNFDLIEDTDLDAFLNELDQEDLEDLL